MDPLEQHSVTCHTLHFRILVNKAFVYIIFIFVQDMSKVCVNVWGKLASGNILTMYVFGTSKSGVASHNILWKKEKNMTDHAPHPSFLPAARRTGCFFSSPNWLSKSVPCWKLFTIFEMVPKQQYKTLSICGHWNILHFTNFLNVTEITIRETWWYLWITI